MHNSVSTERQLVLYFNNEDLIVTTIENNQDTLLPMIVC